MCWLIGWLIGGLIAACTDNWGQGVHLHHAGPQHRGDQPYDHTHWHLPQADLPRFSARVGLLVLVMAVGVSERVVVVVVVVGVVGVVRLWELSFCVCVCLVVTDLVWWLRLQCHLDCGFGCCCACSNFGCCCCNGVGFRYFNDYGRALMLKSMQQFTYAGCPDGFCVGLAQFADGTHINDSIWRECPSVMQLFQTVSKDQREEVSNWCRSPQTYM